MERYEQIASEGHWLYDGDLTDDNVIFMKKASRPVGVPPFPECTDAEKVAWEEEHPQPEPPEELNNE